MSLQVLPSLINYDEQLRSLMSGVNNFTQSIQPNNGSSFTQNSQIIFELPNRGFIDPKSIYLRYKHNIVVTTAGGMCACPLYTPIVRMDLFFNNQLIESINDYNLVATQWLNLNVDLAGRIGIQSAWGFNDVSGVTTKFDSRALPVATNNYSVAGPLIANILSNCEKFIPAFAMGAIRIVLTLDSFSNMFTNGTAITAGSSNFTNFELVYDMVDFGAEIEQQIMNRDSIVIKSNSYNLQGLNVPSSTNGTNTFVFNQRFASIRNAILSTSSANSATYLNGKFDSVDLTAGSLSSTTGGSYALNIGGVMYPQGGPQSTINNRSGLLMELRKAIGSLYDWSKNFYIAFDEFAYAESGASAVTTADSPAKFYVGFDLNKINSASNMMLNGTSSQNTPINAIVQINTATANAHNLNLMLNYDVIITLDPRTKQVSVLQ